MLIHLKADFQSVIQAREGLYSLTMTNAQANDLLELLAIATGSLTTSIKELRKRFLEEEGYMESDEYIMRFYNLNKELT